MLFCVVMPKLTRPFNEKIKISNDLVSSSTNLNIGYLFLQKLYHDLEIGSFFRSITADSRITFDPNLVNGIPVPDCTVMSSYGQAATSVLSLGMYSSLQNKLPNQKPLFMQLTRSVQTMIRILSFVHRFWMQKAIVLDFI